MYDSVPCHSVWTTIDRVGFGRIQSLRNQLLDGRKSVARRECVLQLLIEPLVHPMRI